MNIKKSALLQGPQKSYPTRYSPKLGFSTMWAIKKCIAEGRHAWNGEIGDNILVYMTTVGVGISIIAKRRREWQIFVKDGTWDDKVVVCLTMARALMIKFHHVICLLKTGIPKGGGWTHTYVDRDWNTVAMETDPYDAAAYDRPHLSPPVFRVDNAHDSGVRICWCWCMSNPHVCCCVWASGCFEGGACGHDFGS